MKITTTKEKIQNAVLMAEKITGKKESLPILSCILIEAGKDIVIRSTNLESGIEIHIDGECIEEGMVAVPAIVLSQTIRSITGDTITLSTDESNLLIDSRGTKTLIKAVSHTEFPTIPKLEVKNKVVLARDRLISGIQSVSYAASLSMIRPDLGSIYLSVKNGSLTCVATDSFRLAEKTITDTGAKMNSDLLVPLRHAVELVHVLERLDGNEVSLAAEDTQLIIIGGGTRYVSRVVDATFPNYKEIIPKAFTTEATMLKSDFSEMLRKARVFSGNDMHVGLHVYPEKKLFSATARSADVGEMSDTVDSSLTGEDIDINFHIGYLADCLGSISSDSIVLGFAGAGKPLVIKGVSDKSFMYLVMPLNK